MSLTAEEFTAHIHRISELSGDNEEVMNLLNDIQQDRTEPQFTEVDVFDKDGKRYSEKYGDIKKQIKILSQLKIQNCFAAFSKIFTYFQQKNGTIRKK